MHFKFNFIKFYNSFTFNVFNNIEWACLLDCQCSLECQCQSMHIHSLFIISYFFESSHLSHEFNFTSLISLYLLFINFPPLFSYPTYISSCFYYPLWHSLQRLAALQVIKKLREQTFISKPHIILLWAFLLPCRLHEQ